MQLIANCLADMIKRPLQPSSETVTVALAGGRRQRRRECRCSSRHDWTAAHRPAFTRCRQTAPVTMSTAVEDGKIFRSDSVDVSIDTQAADSTRGTIACRALRQIFDNC